MAKGGITRTPAAEVKTQYPINILVDSKNKFQTLMKSEKKTVWELFRDMVKTYEETKQNPAA